MLTVVDDGATWRGIPLSWPWLPSETQFRPLIVSQKTPSGQIVPKFLNLIGRGLFFFRLYILKICIHILFGYTNQSPNSGILIVTLLDSRV
jgi:hypothetical protein